MLGSLPIFVFKPDVGNDQSIQVKDSVCAQHNFRAIQLSRFFVKVTLFSTRFSTLCKRWAAFFLATEPASLIWAQCARKCNGSYLKIAVFAFDSTHAHKHFYFQLDGCWSAVQSIVPTVSLLNVNQMLLLSGRILLIDDGCIVSRVKYETV